MANFLFTLLLLLTAAITLAICVLTLLDIRASSPSKAQQIGLGCKLIVRSGLLTAAIFGLGKAAEQSGISVSPNFVLNAINQAISAAAWLVPFVFTGVGVNVLANGLIVEPQPRDKTTDEWINSLPRWIALPMRLVRNLTKSKQGSK